MTKQKLSLIVSYWIKLSAMPSINIFWFRRDLRLKDNAGLYHALKSGQPVLPLFIFDTKILDKLEDKQDARVHFLHQTITELEAELAELGSTLLVKYGNPTEIWEELTQAYSINSVYANHDYEPYALERDLTIEKQLQAKEIAFHTYKDHVIFEKTEVTKNDGLPYTVFTPYSRKWKAKLQTQAAVSNAVNQGKTDFSYFFQSYPNEQYFDAFLKTNCIPIFKWAQFPHVACTHGVIYGVIFI